MDKWTALIYFGHFNWSKNMRIHHTPYDDNDNDTDVNDNDDDADDDVAEDSDYYNADEDNDDADEDDDDADEEDKEALAALVPAREDPRLSEWPEPFHNLTGDHPQYSHYHRYQP